MVQLGAGRGSTRQERTGEEKGRGEKMRVLRDLPVLLRLSLRVGLWCGVGRPWESSGA